MSGEAAHNHQEAIATSSRAQHDDDVVSNAPVANGAAGDDTATVDRDGGATPSEDDHVVEKTPPEEKLTFWQKVKAHYKKWWWVHLIVLVILLAILLPLLFKVIVPAIVQSIVSGQKLPVYGGALRALTPDMIEVTLDTSLDTALPATIKPMDLSLYNKNDNGDFYPFLELPLPQQHVYHKTGVHVDKAHVKVENHKELVKWFHTVFDEATCKVSVKAKPGVRLGALKYHPKLDKTIDIPALDYLKGFGVIDIGFMLSDNNTGPNMKGQLNLPNAGALTLGLGNITFNLMSGDVKLGLVNVYDVELKPGNNTNNFDGYLYFNELVPNLSAILDSQKGALSQGVVEFNATGNATVVNGQHIKFVEEVLVSKHLTFTYPVVSLLGSVLSGVLDGDNKNNLLDIFGDVVGNSTLLDGIMGHWDDNAPHHNNTRTRKKMKRTAPKSAFMWSMLKLGAKAKAKRA